MTKEEFETLTGKAVTVKVFRAFEAAYMASTLDKRTFCMTIKEAVPQKKDMLVEVDYCADGKTVYAFRLCEVKEDGLYLKKRYYSHVEAESDGISLFDYPWRKWEDVMHLDK